MKKNINISVIFYNIIQVLFGFGSFFSLIATIERETDAKLPGHHSWTDDYFIWCEYIRRKSRGENVSLTKMREKHFIKWQKKFKKTREKMDKRDMSGLIN